MTNIPMLIQSQKRYLKETLTKIEPNWRTIAKKWLRLPEPDENNFFVSINNSRPLLLTGNHLGDIPDRWQYLLDSSAK